MMCARPEAFGLITAFLLSLSISCCCAEDVVFLGQGSIAATDTDLSGDTEAQEDGTPQNRLGGLGSGIAWLGKGNQYAMIPDRGPGDGATSYRCRFQIVEIAVDPQSKTPVTTHLLQTNFLTTSSGEHFVGRSAQIDSANPAGSLRMDPEAIRATKTGSYLIADEYGPTIREFDAHGKLLKEIPTPQRYSIAHPAGTPERELPPHNLSGRQSNRGWEGLGLSDDGQYAYALLQSPLIQDGGLDAKNNRVGTNVRLWEVDLHSGTSREYLYPLENKSVGCSEIEWLAPHRLLVLERDGKPGDEAKRKRIYEIDLTQASDISGIDRLPSQGIPDGVKPVTKRLFLDLLSPEYQLAGPRFPEKVEGIALGPQLPDGSRLLMISTDNDFKRDEATWIYVFAIKSAQ